MSDPVYLTLVYQITHPAQQRALLKQAEWSVASKTNAIQERDKLQAQINAANKACNELRVELEKAHRERDKWRARLLGEIDRQNRVGGAA